MRAHLNMDLMASIFTSPDHNQVMDEHRGKRMGKGTVKKTRDLWHWHTSILITCPDPKSKGELDL